VAKFIEPLNQLVISNNCKIDMWLETVQNKIRARQRTPTKASRHTLKKPSRRLSLLQMNPIMSLRSEKEGTALATTPKAKTSNRKKISLDQDTLSCMKGEFCSRNFKHGVHLRDFMSDVITSSTVRDVYMRSDSASDYYITTVAEDDDAALSIAFERKMNVAASSPEDVRKRNYRQFQSNLRSLQSASLRKFDKCKDANGEVRLKSWDEALAALSTVFTLPENANGDDEEQVDTEDLASRTEGIIQTLEGNVAAAAKEKKPLMGVEKYLKIITKKARDSGVIGSTERWRQVKMSASVRPPMYAPSIGFVDKMTQDVEKKIQERKLAEEEKLAKEVEELEAKRKAEEQAEIFKNALRPLTEKEQSIVQTAIFGMGPPSEILATSDTDTVQRESMWRLQPGQWLNDEVIHYFLLCLARRDEQMCQKDSNRKRSHFFKSFFVSKLMDEASGYRYQNVKRWSKKVAGKDVFALDKIVFPINVGGVHWTCAVAFMQEKKIQFYDSMGGGGQRYVNGLLRYFEDEHKDKKKAPLDTSEWNLVTCQPDTPQQLNGFDCGVFTCMFADFLSRDMPLIFSQEHVTECRERIALSIMNGSALF